MPRGRGENRARERLVPKGKDEKVLLFRFFWRGQMPDNKNLGDRLRERPVLQGVWKTWGTDPTKGLFYKGLRLSPPAALRQHCQQLGDLLRVAGGVGSDATAEAVDGRAKAARTRRAYLV